jgi:hypothetical protein
MSEAKEEKRRTLMNAFDTLMETVSFAEGVTGRSKSLVSRLDRTCNLPKKEDGNAGPPANATDVMNIVELFDMLSQKLKLNLNQIENNIIEAQRFID